MNIDDAYYLDRLLQIAFCYRLPLLLWKRSQQLNVMNQVYLV